MHTIVKELDVILSGGNISNIYEVEDLLILKINTTQGNKNIIIEKDSRLNITEYDYPVPQYPSQYIINLRKLLRNRRIIRVSQYKLDRIVIFELSNFNSEPWKFIIELFSKGNYILIDENGKIKIAKRYKKLRNRDILAKNEYKFPKSYGKNFLTLDRAEFEELFEDTDNEIVRILARGINIAGLYAEEMCQRAKINKKVKANELQKSELETLYNEFKDLRNQLLFREIKAHIVYDENGDEMDFVPFELELYKGKEREIFDSFNKTVDAYFSKMDSKRMVEPRDKKIKSKIKSQEKILNNQYEYLEELKNKKQEYYEDGDEIYANFNSLEKLLNVIRNAKKKGFQLEEINQRLNKAKKEGLSGTEFFKRIKPSTREVTIEINSSEIDLDIRKTIGENADQIYKKGKKAKKKIEGTINAIEDTKAKIKKLKKEKEALETKIDFLVKKPKKSWYEKYRWFKSSQAFLIVGGRDATSNEVIFKKYMNPQDLVFHTEFPGSPLALIKNPNEKDIPEETIRETAEFVASYSQAWKQTWGVADVFYVKPKQVSQSPPSGEYLPKGSFIISGNKRFVKNAKTILAVGVKFIELEQSPGEYKQVLYPKVIAGPVSAIKKQTETYIIILPSKTGLTKGNLAKKIKPKFFKMTDDIHKKWIELLSLDEILLMLPNGNSTIKK